MLAVQYLSVTVSRSVLLRQYRFATAAANFTSNHSGLPQIADVPISVRNGWSILNLGQNVGSSIGQPDALVAKKVRDMGSRRYRQFRTSFKYQASVGLFRLCLSN